MGAEREGDRGSGLSQGGVTAEETADGSASQEGAGQQLVAPGRTRQAAAAPVGGGWRASPLLQAGERAKRAD